MKTITLKTDEQFFEKINNLAKQFHLTKSELIRRSVSEYASIMERKMMKEQMKEASLRVREANREIVDDFAMMTEDGLDNV